MNANPVIKAIFLGAAVLFADGFAGQTRQAEPAVAGDEITILVTAHPHNERMRQRASSIQPSDFVVREDGRVQRILSVKPAKEAPPVLAVLIQDDLVSRVNNEIREIKRFINGLPEGASVMTGYLGVGGLRVTQEFTRDLKRAADSLRIVHGSAASAPFNPYVGVVDTVRRFESQPKGRRMILMVSDGLDVSGGLRSASPSLSLDLDRAVREAQRHGVSVFTIYAPSVGLTSVNRTAVNFGQGSLNRLADETGGEAFFSGTTFVTFTPYFREMNQLLGLQWVITYRSDGSGSGFRRIEVTTDVDVHLHYAVGYSVRGS